MKALGIGAEEHYRSVGWFSVVEQVEVSEQRLRRGVGLEREAALAAGGFKKPVNAFAGKIFQPGALTCGGVKRRDAQRPQPIKIFHHA